MLHEILFKTRSEWRDWLESNHNKERVIWLIYYKNQVNKRSIKQPEAVEEALCYGWIDSIVKRIDDEKYKQKFTPRKENSIWSDLNKKRVSQLTKNGKMTKYGMRKVNMAKRNGMWKKIQNFTHLSNMPQDFELQLNGNDIAKKNFDSLAPSYKKQFIYWINDAKKEDTKKRRIKKTIELLKKGEKLGMV